MRKYSAHACTVWQTHARAGMRLGLPARMSGVPQRLRRNSLRQVSRAHERRARAFRFISFIGARRNLPFQRYSAIASSAEARDGCLSCAPLRLTLVSDCASTSGRHFTQGQRSSSCKEKPPGTSQRPAESNN